MLFVDEIHRFNRAQQDSFLPVMEDGSITLIGATTENPSFELNAALLSRARVLTFRALDEAAIEKLLARAEEADGKPLPLDEDARTTLIRMADGDGRAALTLAEEIFRAARPGEIFDINSLTEIVQRRAPIYDKAQDGHYNLICACTNGARLRPRRGALLSRPHVRRRRRPAVHRAPRRAHGLEDIGLADPQALSSPTPPRTPMIFWAVPEGELAIAAGRDLLSRPRRNRTRSMSPYKAAMRLAARAAR